MIYVVRLGLTCIARRDFHGECQLIDSLDMLVLNQPLDEAFVNIRGKYLKANLWSILLGRPLKGAGEQHELIVREKLASSARSVLPLRRIVTVIVMHFKTSLLMNSSSVGVCGYESARGRFVASAEIASAENERNPNASKFGIA